MSQENVEIVREALEAGRVAGVEAMLPFVAPDVVMYPADGWLEDPAYRGHEGFRRLFTSWADNFDDYTWEVHDIRDAGSRVVALVEVTGRIKESGVPAHEPRGLAFTRVRDGKAVEIQIFRTWDAALKAVGIEE